jgi:hypothetical protein
MAVRSNAILLFFFVVLMPGGARAAGLYKDRFDVQLTKNDLFISLRGRGGVKSVMLRFDDEPARQLRLASEMEQKIEVVDIQGDDFEKLLGSKRLRVRILTVLDTLVDEDLSLNGLEAAHAVIAGPEDYWLRRLISSSATRWEV